MKLLVIGDPHFRLDLPYADYFKDRRRDEWNNLLKFLHEQAKDCDGVVLMGDNLDKRHNHSSVIKDFTDFIAGFGDKKVFIMSGNHETYEGTKTAIDFLEGKQENVFIFTPSVKGPFVFMPDKQTRLVFIPYMTRAALSVDTDQDGSDYLAGCIRGITKIDGPIDVIFSHHAISGTKTIGGMVDLFHEIVLPREKLEAESKLLVGGHIHQASRVGKTLVTGSMFTQEMGEAGKSAWKLTIGKTVEVEEVPLPVRPIHKFQVFSANTKMVLAELDSLDKHAIIKCILTKPGLDVEAIKEKLQEFDANILLEDYPSERARLNVDEKQTLDLSVESLLTLYAKARDKDPERLSQAFHIIQAEEKVSLKTQEGT